MVERWSAMPFRLAIPAAMGRDVNCRVRRLASPPMPGGGDRIPQSSAALAWLSTAFGPHGRTAAIHWPSLAEARMADGINTAMNAVQGASGDATITTALDGVPSHSAAA